MSATFRDVTPYILIKMNSPFRGSCFLHTHILESEESDSSETWARYKRSYFGRQKFSKALAIYWLTITFQRRTLLHGVSTLRTGDADLLF